MQSSYDSRIFQVHSADMGCQNLVRHGAQVHVSLVRHHVMAGGNEHHPKGPRVSKHIFVTRAIDENQAQSLKSGARSYGG